MAAYEAFPLGPTCAQGQNGKMENLLNPTTSDYSGQQANSLHNAAYIRLATPLGSYWAAPGIGSKLYLLKNEKDLPRVGPVAVDYAKQALAPLRADGRASKIDIAWQRPQNGQLRLEIAITAKSGEVIELSHIVEVG